MFKVTEAQEEECRCLQIEIGMNPLAPILNPNGEPCKSPNKPRRSNHLWHQSAVKKMLVKAHFRTAIVNTSCKSP